MSDPQISVVIPVHNEEHWAIRAMRSVFTQVEAPAYEIVIVIDKAAQNSTDAICAAFKEAPEGVRCQPVTIDAGSLGAARNEGVRTARGRFISFLDADDLFSATWLKDAFNAIRGYDHDNIVIHHEWSVMFGAQNFLHRHFSSTDPSFDTRDMIQFNPWSALLFAHKSLFERYPYTTRDTYEDWDINARMLGDGVEFNCPPDTCKFIRMKLNQQSLAARLTVKKSWLAKMPLFDKRQGLKLAECEPAFAPPTHAIMQQALYAHHQAGEFRVTIDPQPQIRTYPRQVIWDDQSWLRDNVGTDKHVVLVQELRPGGAEKYAIDWANALADAGEPVTIIETAPGESKWLDRAKNKPGVKVLQWFARRQMQPQERAYALQRAMTQCELESLLVCNSEIGWALVHENAEPIAKRVIAASFSTFHLRGFSSCPPYHLTQHTKNLTIVTDNERHAARMRRYGVPAPIEVIPPRVSYGGRNMRRQTFDTDRLRLLWAGRGSFEKWPQTPASVAASMPNVDVHIWGDVQPMPHLLPNLKYRGPFESFDKIDGTYDAYLLTSETEGMPNTALEAAMAGLPIISTDVGDMKKIASHVYPAPVAAQAQHHVKNAVEAISAWGLRKNRVDAADTVQAWANAFAPAVLKLVKQ